MGQVFRFIYVLVPLAMTIASLLSLTFYMVGGIDESNHTLNKNYIVRLNTENFTYNPNNSAIENALISSDGTGALAPVASDYFIYYSTYCAANTSSMANATDIYADIYFCEKTEKNFFFNATAILGLNNTIIGQDLPKELEDGIKGYADVAGWMYIAYMIAFWVTAIEGVLGLFAICSRLVSFFVTIIAGFAALFTFAASLTTTITYSVLTAAVNTSLRPYGAHASLGSGALAATWLAFVFAFGSFLFFSFSICCCNPHNGRRSRDRGEKRGRTGTGLLAERTGGGYERVASPYLGARDRARSVSPQRLSVEDPMFKGHQRGVSEGVPMMDMPREQGAYEPFRHQGVSQGLRACP